ncbi:hypothetical protein ASG31_07870 [Chryseobacterium sp. Leaf404]|nr:hypothetical protein ASG31_07870 [Chryseobacterium sp. Leaf404]
MKFKLGIIIFLIGFLITLVGAWLKITHITLGPFNGNIVLTLGTFFQVMGIIVLIVQMLMRRKS